MRRIALHYARAIDNVPIDTTTARGGGGGSSIFDWYCDGFQHAMVVVMGGSAATMAFSDQ